MSGASPTQHRPSVIFQDTYYPRVFRSLRSTLDRKDSYAEALSKTLAVRFGTSDAMSSAFNALGWDALDVVMNSYQVQHRWQKERDRPTFPLLWDFPHRVSRTTFLRWLNESSFYMPGIFMRQVEEFKPDVLYLHDASLFSVDQVDQLRNHCTVLALQCGGPYPGRERLSKVDVFISPVPDHVSKARAMGITAYLVPMAFDPRVLPRGYPTRDIDVSFVGTVSQSHSTTISLLRSVATECPGLQIFGTRTEEILKDRILAPLYKGEAWGLDMYSVMLRSRVALNRHVDWAGDHACNMRLYEVTGCGATLVTDDKPDLGELFDVGTELVTYSDPSEAGSVVRDLLAHDSKRQRIGAAGQLRTLRDHTYEIRMKQLDSILRNALAEAEFLP